MSRSYLAGVNSADIGKYKRDWKNLANHFWLNQEYI